MKKITIFKRNANIALLTAAIMLAGAAGCKKGTFDINSVNPNSPSTVPPQYSLTSSLSGTANLIFSEYGPNVGAGGDFFNNWMGYWTQSGGFTPSNTYVLYQLTSNTGSGNFDTGYINLSNYNAMLKTVGSDPTLVNYRAVGMIMEALVYQRLVDEYNNVPYTSALIVNKQFSYKYDNGGAIYKAIEAKVDSAVLLIKGATSSAVDLGSNDVMFGGDMSMWTKFAKTLKLKMLMRQTQSAANGSLGDAGVKAALAGYTTADFLGAGEDALINPGYSNAADNQENPLYLSVVATAAGAPGLNEKFFRANAYAVGFYNAHNDPRLTYFYYPNGAGVVQGRVYGSQNGNEANSIISAITAFGQDGSGNYNGPAVSSPIIPAFESLFLQAEAIQRGYLTGSAATTYQSAVSESFRLLGVPNYSAAADTYTSQNDAATNFALAGNKLSFIITQKWAALNTFDGLEAWSDFRRTGFPTTLPVSIYPGITTPHIPYRLPYPTSELNFNSANVPDGGTATESINGKIFWMP